MQAPLLSGFVPELQDFTYWESKDKFQMYEDIYTEWVIFAIEEGAFYYEIGNEKGMATFGDLVICPPDTVFRRVIVTPLTFYFFWLNWTEGPGSGDTAIPAGKISILNTARLAHNYAAMKKWQGWPGVVRLSQYSHYCRDMWLMYCEELGEGETRIKHEAIPNPVDPSMQEAQSLIHQRAFTKLSLNQVASTLGITPVQLTKRFNASYGVTPLRYLTALRLKKAKHLLLDTKMTIEQIAECCGYQNGFYLHRLFAKYEHMTPSHYRKTHRI
jgi:AraC-like DNA-binding protein